MVSTCDTKTIFRRKVRRTWIYREGDDAPICVALRSLMRDDGVTLKRQLVSTPVRTPEQSEDTHELALQTRRPVLERIIT